MKLYYVKVDLYGIKAGAVELFSDQRAGLLVRDGSIEPFDPENRKHAAALKAQEKEAAERRAIAEAELRLERENPAAYREMLRKRRRANEQRIAEEAKAAAKARLRDEQEKEQVAKRLRAQEQAAQ